jgi:uncharacterized protein YqeY
MTNDLTLKQRLDADLRDAMRAGDETRKGTLRLLLTAVRNAEIPPEKSDALADGPQRVELNDEAVSQIIQRQVKQRQDSIEAYNKANRKDLAAIEEAEFAILRAYLPAQMSRDEVEAAARAAIVRAGARGPADKGKVMGPLMAELRGKADGSMINAVVTELLAAL